MGTRINLGNTTDDPPELPPPGFAFTPITPADVSAAFRISSNTPIWDQMILELGGFDDS